MTELIANSPTPGTQASIATLAGPCGLDDLMLDTGVDIPATLQGGPGDQFRVTLGTEIMVIDASVHASPWTILQRDAEPESTQAAHAAGTEVFQDLTAGAIRALVNQPTMTLDSVDWVWLNLPSQGFGINAYTYMSADQGGPGDTVIQNDPEQAQATVTADADLSLPVTITTDANDRFIFTSSSVVGGSDVFAIAAGTYDDFASVEAAMEAAVGSESEVFGTYVAVTDNGQQLVLTAIVDIGGIGNGDRIYEDNGAASVLGFTGNPDRFAGGTGRLVIDGGSPQVGDRVAFADVAGGYSNCGVYDVTAVGDGVSEPWVLTRSSDNDTPETLFQYWRVQVADSGTGVSFGPGAEVNVGLLGGGVGANGGEVGGSAVDLNVMGPGCVAIGVATAVGRFVSVAIGFAAFADDNVAITQLDLVGLTITNLIADNIAINGPLQVPVRTLLDVDNGDVLTGNEIVVLITTGTVVPLATLTGATSPLLFIKNVTGNDVTLTSDNGFELGRTQSLFFPNNASFVLLFNDEWSVLASYGLHDLYLEGSILVAPIMGEQELVMRGVGWLSADVIYGESDWSLNGPGTSSFVSFQPLPYAAGVMLNFNTFQANYLPVTDLDVVDLSVTVVVSDLTGENSASFFDIVNNGNTETFISVNPGATPPTIVGSDLSWDGNNLISAAGGTYALYAMAIVGWG